MSHTYITKLLTKMPMFSMNNIRRLSIITPQNIINVAPTQIVIKITVNLIETPIIEKQYQTYKPPMNSNLKLQDLQKCNSDKLYKPPTITEYDETVAENYRK